MGRISFIHQPTVASNHYIKSFITRNEASGAMELYQGRGWHVLGKRRERRGGDDMCWGRKGEGKWDL